MDKPDIYKRQRNYRERQSDKGLILLQRWVTPAEKAAVDAMLKALRSQTQGKAA